MKRSSVCLFLLCAGCQLQQVPEEAVPETKPDPVPEVVPVEQPQVVLPPEQPVKPVPPPKDPVGIVISRDIPFYRQMHEALVAQLDRPHHVVWANELDQQAIIDELEQAKITSVVAIGRDALDAVKHSGINVVYTHVVASTPTGDARSVPLIPPFEMQFAQWKALSPQIQRIGVVVSAGAKPFVEQLQAAADMSGLTLVSAEVRSDKEALIEFRRMVPHIDGFVFFPDEAVLSPNVIRRVMSHATKNGIQVLTYNRAIFKLGAFLHITAVDDDVAQQAMALVDDPALASGSLTKLRMQIQGWQEFVDVAP